jgi:hypothetical protein
MFLEIALVLGSEAQIARIAQICPEEKFQQCDQLQNSITPNCFIVSRCANNHWTPNHIPATLAQELHFWAAAHSQVRFDVDVKKKFVLMFSF